MLTVCFVKAALKILAVDDNPAIRYSMPFIFAGPRYEVSTEPDGDHALARLDTNRAGYDVIIVDQKMAQFTGVELVQEIRERHIAGKIMVLSAHLSAEIREAYEKMDVRLLLDKPFDIQELRSAVDRLAA
jgi:CheY-like chemotaxis protein